MQVNLFNNFLYKFVVKDISKIIVKNTKIYKEKTYCISNNNIPSCLEYFNNITFYLMKGKKIKHSKGFLTFCNVNKTFDIFLLID